MTNVLFRVTDHIPLGLNEFPFLVHNFAYPGKETRTTFPPLSVLNVFPLDCKVNVCASLSAHDDKVNRISCTSPMQIILFG